jgi:hypothetical protein
MPPKNGWKEELISWKTFIEDDFSCGKFAQFDFEREADTLFNIDSSLQGGFFNKRYKDKFAGFSEAELEELPRIFGRLIFNSRYRTQTKLPSSDLDLLSRASAVAGDLRIAYFGHRRRLSELAGGG